MRIEQIVLVAALVAVPLAPALAGPMMRTAPRPIFVAHAPSLDHAAWRHNDGFHGDGFHDFRRDRRDFVGLGGAVFGAAPESGPDVATAPVVVSAPVFVSLTLSPGGAPATEESSGPRIIEIGKSEPPHGPLPLVIYGD
ncbi:MAG: hypothetical protein E7774_08405 [Bradyrhizobium sp.]|nr:MAG: hypothetical protein E7774_08405 [Bradyrhizobium sp.]